MLTPIVTITEHAIDRYIERVASVCREEARARMLKAERGIRAAAAFGALYVKIDEHTRLVCIECRVVSVYGAFEHPCRMPPDFWPAPIGPCA